MEFGPLEIAGLLALSGGVAAALARETARRDEVHLMARRIEADRQVGLAQAYAVAQHRYSGIGGSFTLHEAAPGAGPVLPEATPSLLAGLPGVTTLGQVLATGWRPSSDALLMALGPGGAPITTSLKHLVHVLMIGPTGVGKSNIARLLLPQIATLPDVDTEWWNPHYTPRDPETGEEWAGMAAATRSRRALVGVDEIMAALEHLVFAELPTRKTRYAAGQHPGPARFVLVDEVPVLSSDKRFMEWIGFILREGRKFGLFIMMATQDALIKTLGGSTGLRANAQTVFYGGGDPHSARALLGFTPPDPPGQGVIYLKSHATPTATLVRVPWADNEGVRLLLGAGTVIDAAPVPVSARFRPVSETAPSVSVLDVLLSDETGPETETIDPAKRAAVLAGLRAKRNYGDLITEIWGVTAGGSARYKTAYAEWQTILADLVGEG